MTSQLESWLRALHLGDSLLPTVVVLVSAVVILLGCFLVYVVAKQILRRIVRPIIGRSKTTWDDALLKWKVLDKAAGLIPAMALHVAAPAVFEGHESWVLALESLATVFMIVIGMTVIDAFLNAFLDIYQRFEISNRVYLRGVTQILRLVIYFVGIVFILAGLIGKSPAVFFGGLGAMSAVLLLIFKDSILGFVAGIQLMSNNMVMRGDWIEVPKYGVDGDVLDVSLMTVKVQNWDKTIATIPSYSLITGSFKNWRGMSDSGGRRIKRSISIDMNSVRFCDAALLERFQKIEYLQDHITRKLDELTVHNDSLDTDKSLLINGRHLTNLGSFRAYLEAYLRQHPKIHNDMTFLIRQLPPTSKGLPIEIYVFCNDQAWASYEAIQADIFDHILASLPLFDLRVFQEPAGADVSAAIKGLQSHA